jgi:alanine racemase
MAVVKANAYGHGAGIAARVLQGAGVDRFGVAALSEAVELREAGIQAPILVLGYTPAWQAHDLARFGVTATIFDLESARALNQAAAALGRTALLHVKVNTGMNRLGLRPQALPEFLVELGALSYVEVEGIFTHFATSDQRDKSFALEQWARFTRLLSQLENAGLRPPIAHAANSAAVLTMPQTHLQMVRAGIALYGLHPDVEQTRLPTGFRPALCWKASIAQVMELQPGEAVSYGQEFVARRPMIVAVIPVGYADGFPRRPRTWGSVLIHGRDAPILGRVCMDQTIVDVTTIVAEGGVVRQGDEVVLIGRQGEAELSAEAVGERLGTINYDVVSRILARVPRVLVHG